MAPERHAVLAATVPVFDDIALDAARRDAQAEPR